MTAACFFATKASVRANASSSASSGPSNAFCMPSPKDPWKASCITPAVALARSAPSISSRNVWESSVSSPASNGNPSAAFADNGSISWPDSDSRHCDALPSWKKASASCARASSVVAWSVLTFCLYVSCFSARRSASGSASSSPASSVSSGAGSSATGSAASSSAILKRCGGARAARRLRVVALWSCDRLSTAGGGASEQVAWGTSRCALRRRGAA
mmetsp:Transcript_33102/g.99748  ORF Transcript_33102/g.99748 Transcript_33102/m.99748 type:complete len:216 (-) Transcript_33102:2318-2965(-)